MTDRFAQYAFLLAAVACAVLAEVCQTTTSTSDFVWQRQAGTLRVMTWNVGGSLGTFGRALPADRQAHVLGVIHSLSPDVLVLQEVSDGDQVRWFRDGLGADWDVFAVGEDRLIVLAFRQVQLVDGFASFPHADAAALLGDLPDGRSLALVGVHADAYDAEKRNEVLGAVHDYLAPKENTVQIVAGDLNLDVGRFGDGQVFSANDYRDLESYNYLSQQVTDVGLQAGPTADPHRRLDYIFVRGLQALAVSTIHGQRRGDMDHDPLCADFRLAGKGH